MVYAFVLIISWKQYAHNLLACDEYKTEIVGTVAKIHSLVVKERVAITPRPRLLSMNCILTGNLLLLSLSIPLLLTFLLSIVLSLL